jgi:hypothetical protein
MYINFTIKATKLVEGEESYYRITYMGNEVKYYLKKGNTDPTAVDSIPSYPFKADYDWYKPWKVLP